MSLASVSATDEWCAEAHMETNYSAITSDFEEVVRNYAMFRLLGASGHERCGGGK